LNSEGTLDENLVASWAEFCGVLGGLGELRADGTLEENSVVGSGAAASRVACGELNADGTLEEKSSA
jgi:hypothetical protein